MPVLSIVSPVHCEEEGVSAFLDCLERHICPLHLTFEVILVDDGSTDDTWLRVVQEAARRPYLRGLRLSRNFGKEGHKERVDAFNAALIAELGKENCTSLLMGYN